jgi:hypothetical protein
MYIRYAEGRNFRRSSMLFHARMERRITGRNDRLLLTGASHGINARATLDVKGMPWPPMRMGGDHK